MRQRAAALGLAVFLLLGCGSTTEGGGAPSGKGGAGGASVAAPCPQGDTRVCLGAGRCPGAQICEASGRWSPCDCGSSGPDGSAPPGSGGAPSSVGDAGPTGNGLGGAATTGAPLGRACQADADCGSPGVICVTATSTAFGAGGPPNGTCVADCSKSATACAALDPAAVCVAFSRLQGGPAYCFEGCTIGPSNGVKCHGRGDAACDDNGGAGIGDGFCRPACRGDFDCAGRRCDFVTGMCVDPAAITGTIPVGGTCDPTAAQDLCLGACLPLDTAGTAGVCAGTCSIGHLGCGESPASTTVLVAACIFDATMSGGGNLGDLGYCGALCDCDTDCASTGLCSPLTASETAVYGRAGFCAASNGAAGPPDHIATCPPIRP